jgi:trans-aconitate 2-methyltransferase
MVSWSAAEYVKFEDDRTRPVHELLARVPMADISDAVDLGCGPGNSTAVIAERYPRARIIGVDTSPDMLAAARARLPDVTFTEADVGTWTPPRPVDLILANAVLHWVPDHLDVVVKLVGHLNPGGAFAFQVPNNELEPSRIAIRETLSRGPWAEKFRTPPVRQQIPPVEVYYDRLSTLGSVDIWRTIYNHPMEDAQGIADWNVGTALRPVLDRLDESERPAFMEAYVARLAEAYPTRADGRVLHRFPRLFVVVTKH